MRIIRYFIGVISLSFVLATSPVLAADFDKGLAAYLVGDYKTALHVWTPLAEDGNAEAQNNLGYMYEKGEGVLQDYQQAEKWYRLAAEQGHATAQYNLGVQYAYGEGVLQDYQRAHMWANLARSHGYENTNDLFDVLTPNMTSSDITRAQQMARECLDSGYKIC